MKKEFELVIYFIMLILSFIMQKLPEPNTRSRSLRRYRFFTDTESILESSYEEESNEPKEGFNITQRHKENKSNGKFRDVVRRNYKFLTETEYSNPLYSAFEEDSFSFKREKSPIANSRNPPHKKLKGEEVEQVDLNKIVE